MNFAKGDVYDLKYAKIILENPSLVARISNLPGTPIEKGFEHLPAKWVVYLVRCSDNSLYCGINNDFKSRLDRTQFR
jgi:hypothetical protein